MTIRRIDLCCGPQLLDNKWYFSQETAVSPRTFTFEEHGLGKVPYVTLYDMEGHEFDAEIHVDDETFDVTVTMEDPIPYIITMN